MAASGDLDEKFVSLCDNCKALIGRNALNSVAAGKGDPGGYEVIGIKRGNAQNVNAAGEVHGNVYNISICNCHHDLSGPSADGDEIDTLEKKREQLWYIEDSENFKKVKEILGKRRLVVITGAPNEGKTTLARQIFDTYGKNNYERLYYKNSRSVSLTDISKENSVILFEGMFHQEKMDPPREKIKQIMREIENQVMGPVGKNNSFFIIVCQLFDMKRAKSKLSPALFGKEYVVNISDIDCTEDHDRQWQERLVVLQTVASYLSNDEKRQIAKHKPFMIGFHGMCAYYNSTAKISFSYLSFPQEFYSEQIKTLIAQDADKEWLFVILTLCGGVIDLSDESKQNIQRKLHLISELFGKKTLKELQEEIEYLTDTYLMRIDGIAMFRYRVLHMACFVTIAQCFPNFISKHCKIEFLDDTELDEKISEKEDTKTNEEQDSHGKLQIQENIIAPVECGTLLIEDVKQTVRSKRYSESLKSPILFVSEYRFLLLEMLEKDEHNNYVISNDAKEGGNFIYWTSDSGNTDLTLEVLDIPKVSTRDIKLCVIACVERNNASALKSMKWAVEKCGRMDLKFNINFTNESRRTPLMLASMYGHVEMVTYILQIGGNLSLTDYNGQNCAHLAAEKGHANVFQLLTNKDKGHVLNVKDNKGFIPDLFLRQGEKVAESLSEKNPYETNGSESQGKSETVRNLNAYTLRLACMKDEVTEVKHILAKGKVDIDEKCTMAEDTPVLIAAKFGSKNVFEVLVNEGCDMTVVNDDGCNILHAASIEGNVDIVEYILNHNLVDVNGKDSQGRTPAYIASQRGHVAVVELLRVQTTKTRQGSKQTLTAIQSKTGSSSVLSTEKGKKQSHQQQVPEESKGPISSQESDDGKSHQEDRDKATDITLKCDGDPPRLYIISDIDVDGKDIGLRVLWMEKAASIELNERLRVNDRIIEINGTHLEGVCFHSAQKIFWDAMRGAEVRLKVIGYQRSPIMPKPKVRPRVKPAPLPPKGDNSPQSRSEKTSKPADMDKSLTNNQQKLLTQNRGHPSPPGREPTFMPKPTLDQKGSSHQLSQRQHETSNQPSPSPVVDETDHLQKAKNQKPKILLIFCNDVIYYCFTKLENLSN